ncbi:helix-turn-helix domain-containing protein [uncultured Albimonas sp.]|uniref:helix-turn-helix domain-containing protein n=1 Tax=uncultured Albimonas sp. TaxID=1331701 RepID=UPI0030EB7E6C|tara:strand:- start:4027 stop:4227 length:201 start_codon:yes stop_codon:yes gene_type:complete
MTDVNPRPATVTPNEAADMLDISPVTVRRYYKEGLLRGRKIGTRLIRIETASVDELIAQGEQQPAD